MADVNANMARFMEARERAKKLIQMDANGSLDKYGKDRINEFRGSFDKEHESFTESIIPENIHNTQRDYSQMPIPSNSKLSQSKLPNEILESFKKKQIDTSLLGVETGQASVLDLFPSNTPKQVVQESQIIQEQPKVIKETVQTSISNVDYSLIKTIVEDCMKKYTSALKKSIINENKNLMSEDNSLQAMKIGNKFTFITKNGDLYEANLKFVKNINK